MKDLTPAKFKCAVSASCPSVHKSDDGRTYLITGKIKGSDLEASIEISAELLEEAIRSQINAM